ncbi:MAG: alanine racemase C-terminal domain-containing protein, partial [Candidatus Izemoplasmatales bacterium]|nr:alanine racemase C-terminal domain-containing protein [Candidatus Izemoplasmatales bacterium]
GRVSMDVCTIDVTDIDVSLYDEAYFVSPNKTDVLSVKHMASLINTIEYEVLCNLGTRIKRTYISG